MIRNVPAFDSQAGNALPEYPPAHLARLESSRRAILETIGPSAGVTLVRTVGNLGDRLIWAGTRRLLASIAYRELGLDEATRARGETAVVMGGGAWCKPYHELMPAALSVLESRYERVIVLPSSFDVSVGAVRRALERTKATVFARELESHHQIAPLCDARLALDSAFFFDFAPFRLEGSGILYAYRSDAEASGEAPVERHSRDISATLSSLNEWLWTIARHAEIRTDRSHVMIAGALLGKVVEFHSSSYHKLPAIADYALADFPVRRGKRTGRVLPVEVPHETHDDLRERLTAHASASLDTLPPSLLDGRGEPRVTIVVLSWNRLEMTTACIESIAAHVRMPARLMVIDNGSDRAVCERLSALCERHPFAELHLLGTNRGCAGARQYAASKAGTEYIAFIDNDAEIFPGTIEHLIHALDEHPQSWAAGAKIVLPNGLVQFCGGDYREHDGMITFEPLASGRPFDDPAIVSATCRWIGGTTFACRRELFAEFPLDLAMSTYFEDNEWCYRINQQYPQSFLTAPRALTLHHQISKERRDSSATERLRAMDFITPLAHFYVKHGLVQADVFAFAGELNRDVRAARLLFELIAAKGKEWTALQWMSGNLQPLFNCAREPLRDRILRIGHKVLRRVRSLIA